MIHETNATHGPAALLVLLRHCINPLRPLEAALEARVTGRGLLAPDGDGELGVTLRGLAEIRRVYPAHARRLELGWLRAIREYGRARPGSRRRRLALVRLRTIDPDYTKQLGLPEAA